MSLMCRHSLGCHSCTAAADPDYSTATAAAVNEILNTLGACCVYGAFDLFDAVFGATVVLACV
jgi:hypothetical protein